MAGAVDRVGQQHDIVVGPDLEAVALKQALCGLELVADLEHGRVREQRAKVCQRLVPHQLAGAERAELVPMPERQIAGFAHIQGEPDPDQLGLGEVRRRGHTRDRNDASGCRPLEPGVERAQVVQGRVAELRLGRRLARRRGRGRYGRQWLDPLGERAEAMRTGELEQARIVGRPDLQLSQRDRQRCRLAQGDQRSRQARLLGMGEQILAPLRLLDARRIGQQLVQAVELLEQLGRGLDPDPRHAGHIVGGVAGQRQHVAQQLRADPKPGDHLVAVDRLLLHRVVHLDAAADQLHQVLVGRDDDHLLALLLGLPGIGRDQIVGLVVVGLDHRQAERLGRLAHHRELRRQLRRRLQPVRLVAVVDLVPEARAALVEHHHQLVAGHVLDQPEQHVAEAEHGADRHPLGVGQRRQREERAEHVPRPVDQDQALGLGHALPLSPAPTIGEPPLGGQPWRRGSRPRCGLLASGTLVGRLVTIEFVAHGLLARAGHSRGHRALRSRAARYRMAANGFLPSLREERSGPRRPPRRALGPQDRDGGPPRSILA